tara:strand:+ start:3946 stop:4392 length:447 start_codon:yes stop_codon:yes gene_type:complete
MGLFFLMKKSLILSFVLLFVACGVPRKVEEPPIDPYQHLTSTSVLEHCDPPTENYMFPIFGDMYFITRHKNCGGVDDMLITHFSPEISDLQETAVKLLVILYTRQPDENLEYEHIKTYVGTGAEPHSIFYRLINKDPVTKEVPQDVIQ